MAIVDGKTRPVPFAMGVPDRVPKERYFDPGFYALEAEELWPRVWHMACRLEEIPAPGDFVEYEFLDQSIVVVRTDELAVQAFENACRHRGVKVVEGAGTCDSGFTCPFHGWCYGVDGKNTRVPRSQAFAEHNMGPGDIDLTPVRCEMWGGCAWITLDAGAPPLRECLEPAATILEAWRVDSLRTDWWLSCRLPVNWKLAQEAFFEQYHVLETHPQLRLPGRYQGAGAGFDASSFVEAQLTYLRRMSTGMNGMVHANDVRIAERLAALDLPADDVESARATWERTLNDAVVEWHREAGSEMPDLNEVAAAGFTQPIVYCFPHYFVLPMYSSAAAYRFRPLGPEETLMEIWSLTRFPRGTDRPRPQRPEPWEADDPRWPPIPAQDFSNLPKQQRGLHARGFEYMRLSERLEGHISNFERTIDGYLEGRPHDQLVGALRVLNTNPLSVPIADLGF